MMRVAAQARRVAGLALAFVALGTTFLATPAHANDASLWRYSPVCTGPRGIFLAAEGYGVIHFEYRVVNAEPTIHRATPPSQHPWIHRVSTQLLERQVYWRAVATDTDVYPGEIEVVESFCGG
ncbi:hypothetical protein [Plantactinospora sp. DSM 117369]